MRRLPRLPTPASAGLVPTSTSAGPLRACAPAATISSKTPAPTITTQNRQSRRYLSTTPVRLQAQNATEASIEAVEGFSEDYLPSYRPRIRTQLVYPRGVSIAQPVEDVSDPSYTPAESAAGLEEVGGVADWWDDPTHWGTEGGVAQYVQSVVGQFGPAEKVTDPAVLEVLAKRAIVEALVVARFAGAEKRKAVDRLFAHASGTDRLGKIVRAEVVAKEDGTATLKEAADWTRVWDVLKSAVKKARQQQQQPEQNKAEGETAEAAEAESQETAVAQTEAKEAAPAPQLTPKMAKSLMGTWNKDWKKAELRDPVVKFYAVKRIQQLTGHRIPDGKLVSIRTIDSLVKQLIEPPKPKKLAELVEQEALFKGLPNVRVFPRRVTPIDREQMVGRWKIIVKELEDRGLPVTGTGDYGPPIEKRWIEGREFTCATTSGKIDEKKRGRSANTAKELQIMCTPESVAALLRSSNGGVAERTEQLKEVLFGLQKEADNSDRAAVVEALADGARDPSWRLPLGESGLLGFVLSSVPVKEPRHPLNKHALRLVGNACADCVPDENRARVVSSGALRTFIMYIIEDPSKDDLLPFATAAALNLCLDYNAEPKTANPNTPALLLRLAASERYDADLESFMEICTPALAYLTFQDFQRVLLQNGGIELLQLAFYQLYTRFDTTEAASDTADQLKQTLVDWLSLSTPLFCLQTAACLSLGNLSRSDESSISLVPRVRRSLVEIVSRATPPALSSCPTPETPRPPLQLTHAALSFLKNLAIPQVNKPVLGAALLDPGNPFLPRLWTSTRTQPQLQFAAVSLTRLLLANCPVNIRHICAPTTASDTRDISSSSSSKSDNNGSKSNLALLTTTAASADEDSIKIEAARAASQVCRALHSVPVTDVLDPSWTWPASTDPTRATTDEEPAPADADADADDALRARFYAAHGPASIAPSLHHLLTHPRFLALRSEAVFVLALMSRSPEGARAALQVLRHNTAQTAGGGAGWQAVARAITGSDSEELAAALKGSSTASLRVEEAGADGKNEGGEQGKEGEEGGGEVTVEKLSLEPQLVDVQGHKQQQPARVAQMDRENAMVLVAELLRRFPEALSSLRKPLEGLLRKGGELVAKDRGEQEQQ
ncbi:uncharacterized protein P884DRAFT_207163 [Thermothelomyces heterothallicus CBS 202.75]|uniref:uncharacterized protein n=1 Tax=Thermothelomyces heterothallicus CBS 202.75 TaxID=1149848 RepID=UPI00374309FD